VLDTRRIVEALETERVEYVVVGGIALFLHGSGHPTFDIDICYDRAAENLDRVRVMSLDDLEKSKRAAGRRKDLLALDEIAELRQRIARNDPPKR